MKNAKQKAIEVEQWKDISGYKGLYEISNLGRVKACPKKWVRGFSKERIIKHKITIHGYCQVVLHDNKVCKTIAVHRLVALAFIENPENKREVNHINGIKTDNYLENLEWNTSGENQRHAYALGLRKQNGSKNANSTKCIDIVTKIEYGSLVEAYKSTKYSYNHVVSMIHGKSNNKTNLRLI